MAWSGVWQLLSRVVLWPCAPLHARYFVHPRFVHDRVALASLMVKFATIRAPMVIDLFVGLITRRTTRFIVNSTVLVRWKHIFNHRDQGKVIFFKKVLYSRSRPRAQSPLQKQDTLIICTVNIDTCNNNYIERRYFNPSISIRSIWYSEDMIDCSISFVER